VANDVLLRFVARESRRQPGPRVLDLGCGAARNAIPMAATGGTVVGVDVAVPMLEAARRRTVVEGVENRVRLERAPMDELPPGELVLRRGRRSRHLEPGPLVR
jgi:ubiquinone/menaquinone biosynthesis C-methylase UbiE